MSVQVGMSGVYISTRGRQKAAIVAATVESLLLEKEGEAVPLDEGFVHLYVFELSGISTRPSVPLRATAALIPDFYIDGKLVGYFEEH